MQIIFFTIILTANGSAIASVPIWQWIIEISASMLYYDAELTTVFCLIKYGKMLIILNMILNIFINTISEP
jgi:hypothetical protein